MLFHMDKTAGNLVSSHSFSTPPKLQLDTFNPFSHTRQFPSLNPDNEKYSHPENSWQIKKIQVFFRFFDRKPKNAIKQACGISQAPYRCACAAIRPTFQGEDKNPGPKQLSFLCVLLLALNEVIFA